MAARPAVAIALVFLLVGCASIDVNEFALQPSNQTSGIVRACTTAPEIAYNVESEKQVVAAATARLDLIKATLPAPLQSTAVVDTIFRSAKITTANAVRQRHRELSASFVSEKDRVQAATVDAYEAAYIDALPKPGTLSSKDFRVFHDEFSEQVQRHTAASGNDTFWAHVAAYYSEYADGHFVDYFGTKYAKPELSLTVTDAELANAVGVFIELIFDAAAQTPVWIPMDSTHKGDTHTSTKIDNLSGDVVQAGWKVGMTITDSSGNISDGTTIVAIDPSGRSITLSKAATKTTAGTTFTVVVGTFYPGNSTNEPTVLSVYKRKPVQISLKEDAVGCGMTILKARAINLLAQSFSGAASNAVGGAVGTIGGVGASLVIFGKVSIGDNKAVTALIEAVVSQLVKRLTVEAMYPVLDAIELQSGTSEYQVTTFFQSPNAATPRHHPWLP